MTDEDVERLSLAIARALQAARSVSDSEHYDHHQWITEKIKHERAWRRFWERMQEHVIRWGMLSVLSFAFYALWLGCRAIMIKNGLGHD